MPSEQPGISDDERAMRLKAEYDVSVALFGFTEQTVRDDEYRRVRAILRSQATIDVIARKLFHDHILDNPHMHDWDDMMRGKSSQMLAGVRAEAQAYISMLIEILDTDRGNDTTDRGILSHDDSDDRSREHS